MSVSGIAFRENGQLGVASVSRILPNRSGVRGTRGTGQASPRGSNIESLEEQRMKAKKALKRLNKIEELLSDVIDQFPKSTDGLGELLDSAKAAVGRAKTAVNSQVSPRAAKKQPGKAETARQGRLTAAGRARISLAAKKRWAVAKRKGMNAVTGRPLSQSA